MSGVEELLPVSLRAPLVPREEKYLDAETPWHLIAVAVGWTVLTIACAFAIGVTFTIIRLALQLQPTASFRLLTLSVAVLTVDAVLIPVAIVKARSIGNGDARRGLGFLPVARLPLIVVLAVVVAAFGALRSYALFKIRPDLFYEYASVTPWISVVHAVAVVIVAPVAEELFFRGWMWNGLRRHWGALPTALLTTGFWLLLHVDRGIAAVLGLLPLALLIILARQVGNSVRATIPLHIIYNLVVTLPTILMVFGVLPPGNARTVRLPIQQTLSAPRTAPAPAPQAAPPQQSPLVSPQAALPQSVPPQQTPSISPPTPVQTTVIRPAPPQQPAAAPQASALPSGQAPQQAQAPDAPVVLSREVFSGSESQIAAMNYINSDCTSGVMPEVRIVTPPADGTLQMQARTIPIARPPTAPLARCNGRPVEAIVVLYKSKGGFTGADSVVLDVDFRHGKIFRYVFNVTVR